MTSIGDTGLDLELLPGFTKITTEATGEVVYFCRRCHSLDMLDGPHCTCGFRSFCWGLFLIGFVLAPAAAVTVKLLKGGLP